MYAKLTLSDLTEEMCIEVVKCALKGQNPITIGVKIKNIYIEDVKAAEADRLTSVIPVVFSSLDEMQILESPSRISNKPMTTSCSNATEENASVTDEKKEKVDYQKLIDEYFGEKFTEIAAHSRDVSERFEEFLSWYVSVVDTKMKEDSKLKLIVRKMLVEIPLEIGDSNKITLSAMINATSESSWKYFGIFLRNFVIKLQLLGGSEKRFRTLEFVKYYNTKLNVTADTAELSIPVKE